MTTMEPFSTTVVAGIEFASNASSKGGPHGFFDYFVVTFAVAIVALSLYLAAKYLLFPGEQSDDHIKRQILEQ